MLAAADGVISQLHLLRISKSVSWMLRIPVLPVSCYEVIVKTYRKYLLGGGKAPRLSEVHCDRDSVCVKTVKTYR